MIKGQSEAICSSLIICSLFSRFNSKLLYHILHECHTYKNIPANIIQLFEKENFFLISLDDQNKWYRFHHQFQETLSAYGKQTLSNEQIDKYVISGSKWLTANKYFEEAVATAVESKDPQFSISLFEDYKYELLNSDQYNRFKTIYGIFPASWTNKFPELLMARTIILQFEGKLNAIKPIIDSCEYFETDKNISTQTLAEYYIYKGMLYVYQGMHTEALSYLEKGVCFNNLKAESLSTYFTFFKSQVLSATASMEDGLEFLNARLDALHPNQEYSKARLLIAKVMLYKNRNDFSNMESLLPTIIKICEKNSFYEVLGMAYYSQVEILYRQFRLEELTEYFEKSYALRYHMRISWFIQIWYLKALFLLKTNNHSQLNKTLRELEEYALEVENEEMSLFLKFIPLEIAMQKEKPKEINELLSQQNYKEFPTLRGYRYYYTRITYLKTLLFELTPEKLEEFSTMSKRLISFARKSNNQDLLIQLDLLNCLANLKQGNSDKANQGLSDIIIKTSSNHDLLIFTEFGNEIAELTTSIASNERNNSHAQEVVKVIKKTRYSKNKSQLVETKSSLKSRDIRILEMVSRGYKNEEIAEAMFLSPESIKKYLYNIYRELGVENRIKAANKAKALGLLENVN